jgi:magnesium-transporting ATPase (P-type)
MNTEVGRIATMLASVERTRSPLQKQLDDLTKKIGWIAWGAVAIIIAAGWVRGLSLEDLLLLGIAMAISAIPTGMPTFVQAMLAYGANQLAEAQAIVRNLTDVEALGATSAINTDKTGTLTLNQMSVVEAWTPQATALVEGAGYEPVGSVVLSEPGTRPAFERLALAGARCSVGFVFEDGGVWKAHGDPMEAAIDAFARRMALDVEADRAARQEQARFPFDPRTRRMSVVVDGEVVVKGAPDAVLPLCIDGAGAAAMLEELTAKGLRVLAIAGRQVGERVPASAEEAERELALYGLLGLEDPPRPDVSQAIEACRRAGIKVAMITGDHPATASAIATEVGLRTADGVVMSGDHLPADDQLLGALVDRDGIVVARVSPENKLRIARALRARGHVVAMTGDGVNDGPALHEAAIGIAMGRSGTDVAREAADLVLLDDHFASIVAGIEQGRATFANIRRFLTYHLTDNVAELTPFIVWAVSGGQFPLAIGVLQILALDLGTDTLSAVALGAEPPARHLLEDPPISGRLLNATVARRAFGVLGPTIAVGAMAAFVLSFVAAGWTPGDPFPTGHALYAASGAAFMTIVIAQTANAFACRSSTRWPGALGWTTNRLLIPAASIELAFSLAVLLVAPIADELGHTNPPLVGWLVALASAGALIAVDAADKHWRRTRRA